MIKSVVWLGIVFLTIFFYIKYVQYRILFQPYKKIETTPKAIGLEFEDIYFTTADKVKINAWFIPAQNAKYTVLFCHGNAGNISHRLEKISIFHQLGLNVFIFDYRGYGNSLGLPSEKGLYSDATTAYNYLIKEKSLNPQTIILYGESLGGAVVVELATKLEFKALISEMSFSSARDVAKIIFPVVPRFLVSDIFNSVAKINKIKQPKLIISSVDDEIVPFALAQKLFEFAREPKGFLKLRGGHNSAFIDSQKEYLEGLKKFVDSL